MPTPIRKPYKPKSKYANMGKEFEHYIEESNRMYSLRNRAEVVKQHEEITVTSKKGNQITSGFFKQKGAADYIGISHGRSFAFEAKETKETTRFDLSNIRDHQMDFLHNWQQQGAYTFIIVRFGKLHEVYIIPYSFIKPYWDQSLKDGPKSIKYADIALHCDQVKAGSGLVIDYLAVLEKAW